MLSLARKIYVSKDKLFYKNNILVYIKAKNIRYNIIKKYRYYNNVFYIGTSILPIADGSCSMTCLFRFIFGF